jgi:hypothetical protein
MQVCRPRSTTARGWLRPCDAPGAAALPQLPWPPAAVTVQHAATLRPLNLALHCNCPRCMVRKLRCCRCHQRMGGSSSRQRQRQQAGHRQQQHAARGTPVPILPTPPRYLMPMAILVLLQLGRTVSDDQPLLLVSDDQSFGGSQQQQQRTDDPPHTTTTSPYVRCAVEFHRKNFSAAEGCYAEAADDLQDPDLMMNWGIAIKEQALSLARNTPAGMTSQGVPAQLLRRALSRYARAVELGGRRPWYLHGMADAHRMLNGLNESAALFNELNRMRRGIPYDAQRETADGHSAAAAALVDADRGKSAPAKIAKWSQIFKKKDIRGLSEFQDSVGDVCEASEAEQMHALFHPAHASPTLAPMRRWYFDSGPIADVQARGNVYTVSSAKLKHDMGQLARLLADESLPTVFFTVLTNLSKAYFLLQHTFRTNEPLVATPSMIVPIAAWYNTHIWSPPTPRISSGALSSNFDGREVERTISGT